MEAAGSFKMWWVQQSLMKYVHEWLGMYLEGEKYNWFKNELAWRDFPGQAEENNVKSQLWYQIAQGKFEPDISWI
jgi:hypothetical protein